MAQMQWFKHFRQHVVIMYPSQADVFTRNPGEAHGLLKHVIRIVILDGSDRVRRIGACSGCTELRFQEFLDERLGILPQVLMLPQHTASPDE